MFNCGWFIPGYNIVIKCINTICNVCLTWHFSVGVITYWSEDVLHLVSDTSQYAVTLHYTPMTQIASTGFYFTLNTSAYTLR